MHGAASVGQPVSHRRDRSLRAAEKTAGYYPCALAGTKGPKKLVPIGPCLSRMRAPPTPP